MQVTDQLIRDVVQQVLASMRPGAAPAGNGQNGKARPWGVFDDVAAAVAAASEAQQRFEALGLDARRKAVSCIRRICIEQAEPLGREEFEETRIGRLKHKVEKLVVCGEKTPGV